MSNLPTPSPAANPETKTFWDAAAEGRLAVPRCRSCDSFIWYPRTYCPECHGRDVEWVDASGRGTIYSYSVVRRGAAGAYAGVMPYVLAYVDLDEGPRVLTNIVDCDPDSLQIGTEVGVVFDRAPDGSALPRFRPVESE